MIGLMLSKEGVLFICLAITHTIHYILLLTKTNLNPNNIKMTNTTIYIYNFHNLMVAYNTILLDQKLMLMFIFLPLII